MMKIPRMEKSPASKGILYGIGVGPGDPELITVKGLKLLQQVPVIYIPKSSEESGSFALTVVEKYLGRSRQEIIDLVFPMCKDREGLQRFWDQSSGLILERLVGGLNVACICIGDPLFYSTFAHMMRKISESDPAIAIKIIPGVSSISACTAVVNLPLVQAGERLAVIPATYDPQGIRQVLLNFETVVLMKVNRVVDKVLPILEELGLKKQAFFVSRATTDEEEVVWDLDLLKGRVLDYHSMIIIHTKQS
jgi:precorrin-2/cobalt-factor-2 C20-methyltransferase